MQKISLCITNYNRYEYLFESFAKVVDDERIAEIVIVDDNSDPAIYAKIEERCKYIPKVKLYRNDTNIDVYNNKKRSVELATSKYCIVFDSDNVIDSIYLDHIYSYQWSNNRILAPDFAQPVFDYTAYAGHTINKSNVRNFTFRKGFDCLFNTMNYFVHRETYLAVWQPKEDIKGADSIYFNYLWLNAGGEIYVVNGLRYFHRVSDFKSGEHGSNFVKHSVDSTPVCKEIERLLSKMR